MKTLFMRLPQILFICITAIIPTVGDAVEALNEICRDLTDTLQHIVDLSAELSSKDLVRVDNIHEVCILLSPESA